MTYKVHNQGVPRLCGTRQHKWPMVLLLRFKFAMRWKNFVFLPPSLSQNARNFCHQLISSLSIIFSSSAVALSLFTLSSFIRGLSSSITSSAWMLSSNYVPFLTRFMSSNFAYVLSISFPQIWQGDSLLWWRCKKY